MNAVTRDRAALGGGGACRGAVRADPAEAVARSGGKAAPRTGTHIPLRGAWRTGPFREGLEG